MTLENPLILGIILITVGLATALFAVSILLNRKETGNAEKEEADNEEAEQNAEAVEKEEADSVEAVGEHKANSIEAEEDNEELSAPEEASTIEEIPTTEPEGEKELEEISLASEAHLAEEQPAEEEIEQKSSEPQEGHIEEQDNSIDDFKTDVETEMEPIVSLNREPETGELIISVGERSYSSVSDLQESSDWPIVANSLNEVMTWLQEAEPAVQDKTADYAIADRPISLLNRNKRKKKTEPAPQPRSMIAEINDIIQERIRISGKTHLSVRLIESLNGEIKALIGVESYPLEEVPDPQIKEFIRECVAEWERKV
jgi:hypothetical protein